MDAKTKSQNTLANEGCKDLAARVLHKEAVAQLIEQLQQRKNKLYELLLDPVSTTNIALVKHRNATVGDRYLASLWSEFIDLSLHDQRSALFEPTFRGMSWQSLMSNNPYMTLIHAKLHN